MADTSSVGKHLAELFDEMQLHKSELEAAEANVKKVQDLITFAKGKIADYLKKENIFELIAPPQTDSSKEESESSKPKKAKGERGPRTSLADKQAEYEKNRAMYKPENYEEYNGVNKTTGLPVKYKGRGDKNNLIIAQMEDDKRAYEASGTNTSEQPVASEATAHKPTSKKKEKAPAAA